MVRNIAGSLIKVGRGLAPPGWIAELLEQRDRTAAGATAPAQGLYFVAPSYPDFVHLPTHQDIDFPE
jgi:tRNA pseudouridine38-40 synthase